MCDNCNQNGPVETAGQGQIGPAGKELGVRERLDRRRNHLTAQLAQIDVALQLVYTNPDAEKIHEILNRSGV